MNICQQKAIFQVNGLDVSDYAKDKIVSILKAVDLGETVTLLVSRQCEDEVNILDVKSPEPPPVSGKTLPLFKIFCFLCSTVHFIIWLRQDEKEFNI